MELLKKTKLVITKVLLCRYFQNILSEVCLNSASMYRSRIRWLLSSGKAVQV